MIICTTSPRARRSSRRSAQKEQSVGRGAHRSPPSHRACSAGYYAARQQTVWKIHETQTSNKARRIDARPGARSPPGSHRALIKHPWKLAAQKGIPLPAPSRARLIKITIQRAARAVHARSAGNKSRAVAISRAREKRRPAAGGEGGGSIAGRRGEASCGLAARIIVRAEDRAAHVILPSENGKWP